MAKYKAAPGAMYDDEMAEKLGRTLEKLGPDFTPRDVVEAARPKRSPIHSLFPWDVEEAAERHWLHLARVHTSCLRVVVKIDGELDSTRAFHSVVIVEDEDTVRRAYASTSRIRKDAGLSDSVVQQALRQLVGWRKRYKNYKAIFGPVFDAIDAVKANKSGGGKHVRVAARNA